jgi:5S rRNA maturation endonuclease (ribonuclease M5)
MMTQKIKTSRSYNQQQLKIICDHLCDNIDSLIEILDITELKSNGKMLAGCCPIHDGDNTTAFNLYPEGDHYRGNWKCRTHNCEKTFKASIIGFIRGVLSNKKLNWQKHGDQTVTFQDTIEFIEAFLGKDISKIKISKKELEKRTFSSIIKNITSETNAQEDASKITRNIVRKSLVIPCEYFIKRGFDKTILDTYDVGLCDKPDKEMFNRAVVPVYDYDYKYVIGCSGRSIFDKCDACKCYHRSEENCPTEENRWKYCKWKHNKNFKSQNHLYNYWMARKNILDSTKVILVESPGNVWKLEEAGIHNSVAIFGSSLSDRQKILLDGSGAMTIILIMDNDEAGQKAASSITNKCKNTYNILNIKISKPDIAEMSIEEINKEIKAYI